LYVWKFEGHIWSFKLVLRHNQPSLYFKAVMRQALPNRTHGTDVIVLDKQRFHRDSVVFEQKIKFGAP
jgi:hypothetical protein